MNNNKKCDRRGLSRMTIKEVSKMQRVERASVVRCMSISILLNPPDILLAPQTCSLESL